MSTQIETEVEPSVAASRLAAYGVLAAIVALGANAAVRVVALALLDVPAGFDPLGWGPILTTTVIAVAGATAVYGLFVRVSNRPTRHFAIVALVVLCLSFGPLLAPPAFLAGAPASVLATLGAMHVTTAVAAIVLLPRAATRETVDE